MTASRLDGSIGDAAAVGSVVVAGRVSVIIPAYNCQETIAAAVESCIGQEFGDMEIIVVNDGSTDRTLEVLRGFGGGITIISQANRGLAAARNTGVRAATGEFLAWMDGDDLALPERLRIQVGALAARPAINLVSTDFSAFFTGAPDFDSSHIGNYYQAVRRLGGVARIYPHSELAGIMGNARDVSVCVRWGGVYELLLWGNFVHPPTVMVRRSVFDKVGYFDENLKVNSDYDLIIRIARIGPFAFVDLPLLRYRVSSKQMSHAAAAGNIPLETVEILRKVQLQDPETYARHLSVFRVRMAECLISAAEGVASSDRPRALLLLVHGLRLRLLFHRAMRALMYIIVPEFARIAVRRLRRVIASTSA